MKKWIAAISVALFTAWLRKATLRSSTKTTGHSQLCETNWPGVILINIMTCPNPNTGWTWPEQYSPGSFQRIRF